MTIIEALKIVLKDSTNGMTSGEAYQSIIDNGLYEFPAKSPKAVVNSTIRRHCVGLDFPTASIVKHFRIASQENGKTRYALADSDSTSDQGEAPRETRRAEMLPEEQLLKFYNEHLNSIKEDLMHQIMGNPPAFFEHLIMDLLLAMGYGYDRSAGIVVGRPHDGGIDGIIFEDKLGLDLIYLQAKRNTSNNSVGRKELQAFVGAMQNVQKGVFITTSDFSKEAWTYAETQQQKSLKLIDGKSLAEFLIKYEIGLTAEETLKIYRLDRDYFE